ncbi:uncharacterized protein LOC128847658 isoform X1 [Malaclemys terrapin pileata]|uniref:uncharacterized protein LOC128847658 isoform X1 n=1 Tax=Malaclemys terrapin pileata TaxID=2991368 RepID=UPI0023A82A88|nr:uncharacterized protein LOC128847658 isoform X1 [Malaclemys terrapin pileata]
MSGEQRGRLAAVGEWLAAIARSAVAAGVELRAALQEELTAEPEGDQALQPEKIGASSSLLVRLGELRLKPLRSGGAERCPARENWEELTAQHLNNGESGALKAHRSAKQEDDKSKSQEELTQATTPAPQQWEEVFALEAPSTIQQDMNQEMGMLALETIVKNQEAMRSLMAELVQSMGAVEQRIRNIEQEMGLITRFTQELNELGEDKWT